MELNLNDMRRKLEMCLTEELRKEYFALLRRWFSFKSPITKVDFDTEVRKLLVNEEQIRCHNYFMLALLSKRTSTSKSTRNTSDKGTFECADYVEFIQTSSPAMLPPSEYENRSAAAELFMPDSGFVSSRIAITSWENGLHGADENVTEIMVYACQTFVKNIITAMISRKKGYKIRDGKFQYGFNLPIPDPFIRNYHNLIDETHESKTEVAPDGDTFIPRIRPSLETSEQEAAFAYSCAKRRKGDNLLTVQLLYETLKENPKILGFYDLSSINLLKLAELPMIIISEETEVLNGLLHILANNVTQPRPSPKVDHRSHLSKAVLELHELKSHQYKNLLNIIKDESQMFAAALLVNARVGYIGRAVLVAYYSAAPLVNTS